jgi:hypothetical protein
MRKHFPKSTHSMPCRKRCLSKKHRGSAVLLTIKEALNRASDNVALDFIELITLQADIHRLGRPQYPAA